MFAQSLDYDDCENTLYLDEERSRGYKYVVKKSVLRWIIFLLIGVCTAHIGAFIDIAIDQLSALKYRTLKNCILSKSSSN